MKTKLLFTGLFLCLIFNQGIAQNTIVLQPNAAQGKDAQINTVGSNNNVGNHQTNAVLTWTSSGNLMLKRSLIEFDLSSLPIGAIVTNAKLSLYYNPTDPSESFDYHTGSNDMSIERVTSPWNENTVTWNNQPSTTSVNSLSLPPSTSQTQSYLNIDVTNIVIDMLNFGNNGFMLRMVDEVNYYKGLLFASSDHPDSLLHPKLELTYVLEGHEPDTCLFIKPSSIIGKDAQVLSALSNTNIGNSQSTTIYTWTSGGNLSVKRSLIEFDFSSIPSNAIITSAHLSLYYNPTDQAESFDYHTGNNEMYIERVTSPWSENTITWNNQPLTTTVNSISLPQSTSQTQNYINIDVSNLVVDMHNLGNNGFMFRMIDEINYYKGLIFASSDNLDSLLHPEIEICWRKEGPTSVQELVNEKELKIYPNPNNGMFTLNFSGNILSKDNIEITNLVGQEISNYSINSNQIQLNDKGVYFIRVFYGDTDSYIRKVVVQ